MDLILQILVVVCQGDVDIDSTLRSGHAHAVSHAFMSQPVTVSSGFNLILLQYSYVGELLKVHLHFKFHTQ